MKRAVLLLAAAVLLGACVKNKVTGKREVHVISDKAELQLGEETKKAIIQEYGRFLNPSVQSYVNEVGQQIVSVCERKDIAYDFVILDTPLVNAFAVPGTVFVTRGILGLIDDEAELAGVIGHEVGHITGYHSVKLMQKSFGYSVLAAFAAVAGTIYSPSFRDGHEAAAYYETLYRGIGLLTAGFLYGYGREFELEADRSGLRYAVLSGYDPDALISFFKRMDALSDDSASGVSVFLRTHPPTSDRIVQVKRILAIAAEEDVKKKKFKNLDRKKMKEISQVLKSSSSEIKDNFARYHDVVRSIPKMEGRNLGQVSSNTYVNREMGVSLEVPKAWKIEPAYGDTLAVFFSADGKARGELSYRRIQADPALSAGEGPFAGVSVDTSPVRARAWAEAVEPALRMDKRTGRDVTLPYAGPAYLGTYRGMDRVGRPAFYKILYLTRGDDLDRQVGFVMAFGVPDQTYLDYLADIEKIMVSLRWVDPRTGLFRNVGQ